MRNFKKFLALVLSVMMVFGTMASLLTVGASAVDSKDIDTAINFLKALNIMQGYEDGSDGRDDLVTREAAAIFFARITTGYTSNNYWTGTANSTPFTDISKSEYIGAINAVYQMGIINGATTAEGIKIFNPGGNITYQDMLVMAVRALQYNTKDSDGNETMGYPWGYISEATRIGLTENMDGVGFEDALTRGQTAIILYNALNTVLKGTTTTLLNTAFKVSEVTYVLVATENQSMSGYSESNRTGYVTLAKLNTDTGAITRETISVAATTLGLTATVTGEKSAENAIAHSFNVLVKTDGSILSANKNDTKTVQNYGTNSAVKIFNASSTYITIDNVTYELATAYTKNRNISYPELIVYNSSYGDATVTGTATATNNKAYGEITTASTLYYSQFCEITLIDDNNDGQYDRAVFTPYYVDKYMQSSSTVSSTYTAATGLTSTATRAWLMSYDNNDTTSTGILAITGYVLGQTERRAIRQADIVFVNDKYESASRPTNYYYVVYTFNPYTRVFRIVENLGAAKTGTISSTNKVTSSSANSRNSTITIDGTTYGVGYLTTQYLRSARDHSISISARVNNGSIEPIAESYYWSQNIDDLIGASNTSISYVALAGRLIIAEKTSTTASIPDFLAFDITKDLIGVDFDGNLIVEAYVDGTGYKKQVKIGTVNDVKIGQYIINAYALSYTSSSSSSYYSISNDTLKNSILRDTLVRTYLPNTAAYPEYSSTAPVYLYSVDSKNLTTGIYNITNDYTKIDGVNADTTKSITFDTSGIVNQALVATARGSVVLNARFQTSTTTVFLIVGSDGITLYKGRPDTTMVLNIAKDNTRVISANSTFVLIADNTQLKSNIGYRFTDQTAPSSSQTFYMATYQTILASTDMIDGEIYRTYNNMYNLNERKTESVQTKKTVIAVDAAQRVQTTYMGNVYMLNNGILEVYADQQNRTAASSDYYITKLDYVMYALGYENKNVIMSKADSNSATFNVIERSMMTNSTPSNNVNSYVVSYNSISTVAFRTTGTNPVTWSSTTTTINNDIVNFTPTFHYYKTDSSGNVTGYAVQVAYAVDLANSPTTPGSGSGTDLTSIKESAINAVIAAAKIGANDYRADSTIAQWITDATTYITAATTEGYVNDYKAIYVSLISARATLLNNDIGSIATQKLSAKGELDALIVGYTTNSAYTSAYNTILSTAKTNIDNANTVELINSYKNNALLAIANAIVTAHRTVAVNAAYATMDSSLQPYLTVTSTANGIPAAKKAIEDAVLKTVSGIGDFVSTDTITNGAIGTKLTAIDGKITATLTLNLLKALAKHQIDLNVAKLTTPVGYAIPISQASLTASIESTVIASETNSMYKKAVEVAKTSADSLSAFSGLAAILSTLESNVDASFAATTLGGMNAALLEAVANAKAALDAWVVSESISVTASQISTQKATITGGNIKAINDTLAAAKNNLAANQVFTPSNIFFDNGASLDNGASANDINVKVNSNGTLIMLDLPDAIIGGTVVDGNSTATIFTGDTATVATQIAIQNSVVTAASDDYEVKFFVSDPLYGGTSQMKLADGTYTVIITLRDAANNTLLRVTCTITYVAPIV